MVLLTAETHKNPQIHIHNQCAAFIGHIFFLTVLNSLLMGKHMDWFNKTNKHERWEMIQQEATEREWSAEQQQVEEKLKWNSFG